MTTNIPRLLSALRSNRLVFFFFSVFSAGFDRSCEKGMRRAAGAAGLGNK